MVGELLRRAGRIWSPDGRRGLCLALAECQEGRVAQRHKSFDRRAGCASAPPRRSGRRTTHVVVTEPTTAQFHLFLNLVRQVYAVAIDPRGTYVVSGEDDQKIRIWNPQSARLIGVLEGHTAGVTALTVSPDGKFVVSGSDDFTVRIWDVQNKRVVRTLTGHTAPISSVVVSPDGTRILSSSRDHTLRLWSFNAGSELAVLRGHASDVTTAAFNSDGTRIISGSSDRTVRVWDAVLAVPLLTLSNEHEVSSVLFGGDDRLIVSASFGGVFRIWESTGVNTLPNQPAGLPSQRR
jgi:WD40 repeat protein